MIFHQFSYAGDSIKSQISLGVLRLLYPDAPIMLWSDSRSPVDPSLDYSGAIVRQTHFLRAGDLRGEDCVMGMRECYADGYRENPDATHHVKLDPDSLILNRPRLDRLIEMNPYFVGAVRSRTRVGGWFQIHSRAFLDDYLQILDLRKFTSPPWFMEDRVFHEAALKLANGRKVDSIHDPELLGDCVHYRYDQPVSNLREMTAVMFGTRILADDKQMVSAMRTMSGVLFSGRSE